MNWLSVFEPWILYLALWVTLVGGLALFFGKYPKNVLITRTIGTFLVVFLPLTAASGYYTYSDYAMAEDAYAEMDKAYEAILASGDEVSEWGKIIPFIQIVEKDYSYDNHLYIGNFNEEFTYEGRIWVETLDADGNIIDEHTFDILLEPGEKKMIGTFSMDEELIDYITYPQEGAIPEFEFSTSTTNANEENTEDESIEEEDTTPSFPTISDEELAAIEDVTIPETIEEMSTLEAGVFVQNLSTDEKVELDQIETQLMQSLGSLAAETTDPETLFKGTLYYVESKVLREEVNEYLSIKPSIEMPMMPEPQQLDINTLKKESGNKSKAIILLDASSSMLLETDGAERMGTAKNAVKKFAGTVGKQSEVALFVYGHKGTQADADKVLSCSSIEDVYPMQAYDSSDFSEAVNAIEAKGWTPLAEAIKVAGASLEDDKDVNITMYIVSDGAETCGGDPVAEAREFAEKNDQNTVNIIGFDVDSEGENQLKKVAEAGNGKYYAADSPEELTKQMTYQWVPSMLDIKEVDRFSIGGNWSEAWRSLDLKEATLPVSSAISDRSQLIRKVIRKMENMEMISDETKEELLAINEANYDVLRESKDRMEDMKNEEFDEAIERSRQEVDDWIARMKALREEAGLDTN
ncbi:vWA domain-containing protein [Aureibacillus halotolerans]|uniref:Mg-chelatase subunit ChlD n=1 Tax=Aureibacillus halotolerans TaxID=1508390 RepID=A0A4R6U8X4_9BACI|nr:VWA domain-containing protein [Aureibacillus halotolerans]TDQ43028.1 Mg-chelatase subunit ChlD [Aureibacillus halotolerans]